MVMSYSSTFEYFSSSFFHLEEKKKKKKKKSLKTQSNDHRVVTRGQKLIKLKKNTIWNSPERDQVREFVIKC